MPESTKLFLSAGERGGTRLICKEILSKIRRALLCVFKV